jgi:hypothetical protein
MNNMILWILKFIWIIWEAFFIQMKLTTTMTTRNMIHDIILSVLQMTTSLIVS